MINILIVTDDEKKNNILSKTILKMGYNVTCFVNENEILKLVSLNPPNVIVVDCETKNIDISLFLKKIKVQFKGDNLLITTIVPKDFKNYEKIKLSDFVINDFKDENLFKQIINSCLKLKSTLDTLSKNNQELALNLYQLDVMYNTSSKLAGTLDKTKLIDIMLDGLEKSLSFQLSYTLIYNAQDDLTLIINSLHPLSKRFEQAIKLRALLSYNNLFDKKEALCELDSYNIKTIKNVKHPFNEYDLNIFNNDSLFAPIATEEKFFGLIEVFREEEFSQEDVTCFQTIAKQVSLPLESAILYEEIKNANIRLEQLERLKSDFISIVSHELRTPLTAIKNSLDIVINGKTGELSPAGHKFMDMAKRNVERLSGIINDLLDLSKVEAGKMEFRFKKENINPTIDFVKNTFENLAKEKNIKILSNLSNDDVKLYVDSSRIEQILGNLISNAIKFTPQNGEIEIQTQVIEGENINENLLYDQDIKFLNRTGKYFKISVKDNGIGIEKENINKVFDKFRQIENSLNRKTGGTGLGLPIAKQLVNAHNGFIWVESKVKEYTKFSFCLPILNDREVFFVNLRRRFDNVVQNKQSLGIVSISEPLDLEKSLIKDIKDKNLMLIRQKTQEENDFYFEDGNMRYYYTLINNADKFALDFIFKKIETHIKNTQLNDFCDKIIFSSVLYPNECDNINDLLNKIMDKNVGKIKIKGKK